MAGMATTSVRLAAAPKPVAKPPKPPKPPPARGGRATYGQLTNVQKQRVQKADAKTTDPLANFSFPNAGITQGDLDRILGSSSRTVANEYAKNPLAPPSTYNNSLELQNHLSTDLLSAIGAAATYSQGLTTGLSDWIQNNVGSVQQGTQQAATAAGAPAVPAYTSAAAVASPLRGMGTSQTQALNAQAAAVPGLNAQYLAAVQAQAAQSLKDYNTAAGQRSTDVLKGTQDLYQFGVDRLSTSRQHIVDAAIAEYTALTQAGLKEADARRQAILDAQKAINDSRALDISQQNANAHTVSAKASATRAGKGPAKKTLTPGQVATRDKDAATSALKVYNTAIAPGSVTQYQRTVKFTYDGGKNTPSNPLIPGGGTGGPPTATHTFTVPVSDENYPGLAQQFAQFAHDNRDIYKNARIVDPGKATGITTTAPAGPGRGTNWQRALDTYTAALISLKKPGESQQAFRSRMAKRMESIIPRPKAKK